MSGTCKRGIAATRAAIFFLVAGAVCTAQMELAVELFEEGDWNECRRECERVLLVSPSNHSARFLQSAANLRLNRHIDHSIASLKDLVNSEVPNEIRASAAYEYGRAEWKRGRHKAAFQLLKLAFHNTAKTELFLRSACSLFLLMKEKPELRKRSSDLVIQINSSRALWYGELFKECRIEKYETRTKLPGWPGRWIVALYRRQIAPAIGQRCSLEPTCSEYFRQACKKHGLLGFPIQADRFFREPGVVAKGRNPVVVGNIIKYADPLSDHDFWMGER